MSKVTPQPKIGFVSLGCPKNLVDSERILTELRTEGYDVVPSYDDADMVIVNTCGFIDSAVQESLEAIGEALNENGKVIVTGCLGAKEDLLRNIRELSTFRTRKGYVRNVPIAIFQSQGWIIYLLN